MLLCLANIGEIMANVFRYAYVNVCCCACECFRRRVIKPRPARPSTATDHANDAEAWKNRYNRDRAAATDGGTSDDVQQVDDVVQPRQGGSGRRQHVG